MGTRLPFPHPSSLQSYNMKKLHMLQGTSLDRLMGGVLDEGSDKGSV